MIVDDEPAIRLFLSEELTQAGYWVSTVASGEEALACLQSTSVDLILLDLRMGGMSGLEVIEAIEKRPNCPVIIMLTAHASVDSAINVFRHGGHDYLIKPCHAEELLTSVKRGLEKRRQMLEQKKKIQLIELTARQLRGEQPLSANMVSLQQRYLEGRGLLLDDEQEIVTKNGILLELTSSEFQILKCLMQHADRPVSYDQLAESLHGKSGTRWENRKALTTHIWRLMLKVGRSRDGDEYIVNVRGTGYMFLTKSPDKEACSPTDP
jgi:DNA-binding response OmpR family regulator